MLQKYLLNHKKKKIRKRSLSLGQKFWYDMKGLVTRNVHLKYESPISCGCFIKVMTKVKVFV